MKRINHLISIPLIALSAYMTPIHAEAPVVDASENFALFDEQLAASDMQPGAFEDQAPLANDSNDAEEIRFEPFGANENLNMPLAQDNTSSDADNAGLLGRVQTMQQELNELRGQLEVQNHALDNFKEQQDAFFKAMDERMKAGMDSAQATEAPSHENNHAENTIASPESVQDAITATRSNPADEQVSYLAAYDLVKSKEYDKAVLAMKSFIHHYPKGGYTANAYYWLGEVYLIQKAYPDAIQSFESVLSQFPNSSKSSAALLKLGYAFEASGERHKARERFNAVIRDYPGTRSSQIAERKLQTL